MKKIIIYCVLTILTLIILGIISLNVISCQFSSIVYRYKLLVCPQLIASERLQFTGWWQTWDQSGRLLSQIYRYKGKACVMGHFYLYQGDLCRGFATTTSYGKEIAALFSEDHKSVKFYDIGHSDPQMPINMGDSVNLSAMHKLWDQ